MANGFKWKLCNYVGGNTAVKPSFKQYTLHRPDDWAAGEFTVQPRSTSDISINCGFRPSVVMFVCFRPRNANNQSDASFGIRGGGMTFGAAGYSRSADPWDDEVLYSTGDFVKHEGALYQANNANLDDEPPSGNWDGGTINQFTGSSRFEQGFDLNIGVTSWLEDRCLEVVWNNNGTGSGTGFPVLSCSMGSFDANGFTLDVHTNLYDQTDVVFWLAMAGHYQTTIFDSGTTSLSGLYGTPRTAVFMSMKHVAGDTHRTDRWDGMVGMASPEGNFSKWGGGKPVSFNFTTSRWHDADSILFCTSASTSSFVGASVNQTGRVTAWNPGGITLSWPLYDNIPYRVGAVFCDHGTTGYLETNWTLRPEVAGENFEPALINPRVILMTGTDYTFNQFSSNPLIQPVLPNAFQFGGSIRFGWHVHRFNEFNTPNDAWGVSTYANSVAERGHYANSATQLHRNCLMAGAGLNSSPPAFHQHGVNVVPTPRVAGLNYRFAERHAQIKRIHINQSDQYLP